MKLERVIDDELFREEEYRQTPAEMVKDVQDFLANPFTSLEWIGSIAEEVARDLLPYLVDGADELPLPGNEHLVKDAPDGAQDLIVAWTNCYMLSDAAVREGWLKFNGTNLTQAYYLGCAIQRWKVRPKALLIQKHIDKSASWLNLAQRLKPMEKKLGGSVSR